MPKAALRGKGMRILVTNDDGINAPGLKVLEKIARQLSRDVWVVAPEVEQSGAAHSLTLRRPLQIVPLAEFASREEASAEPLLGTAADTALSAGGMLLMYGDGGTSKTTLTIDGAARAAAAQARLVPEAQRKADLLAGDAVRRGQQAEHTAA